jgi:hypothetical protein
MLDNAKAYCAPIEPCADGAYSSLTFLLFQQVMNSERPIL